MLTIENDHINLVADIGPTAIKRADIGRRQRVLINEQHEISNSDGQKLVVTVKVATKPAASMAHRTPGQGLTGRKLEAAPHRATE